MVLIQKDKLFSASSDYDNGLLLQYTNSNFRLEHNLHRLSYIPSPINGLNSLYILLYKSFILD